MRIAVLQTPSAAGDAGAALAALAGPLRAAGAAGCAMLVAPEVFLPGYNSDRIPALAQPRGGDWHLALAELCMGAGCGVTVGYAEREGEVCFNSCVSFDAQGHEIAHYRKIQLYGTRERALYRAGDAFVTFPLNGTKVACLICYDIEFTPHVKALADQGVELILVPTANMVPFDHVVRATVAAMAANHGVAIAYANFCGVEGDLTYLGGSLVAGPHGEVLAQAGTGPALLIVDLPRRDPARLSTQAADFRNVQG